MEANEDLDFSDEDVTIVETYKPEMAIVSAPTILLTLEAGVGNKTLPMLLMHLGFQSNINDWSTNTVLLLYLFCYCILVKNVIINFNYFLKDEY